MFDVGVHWTSMNELHVQSSGHINSMDAHLGKLHQGFVPGISPALLTTITSCGVTHQCCSILILHNSSGSNWLWCPSSGLSPAQLKWGPGLKDFLTVGPICSLPFNSPTQQLSWSQSQRNLASLGSSRREAPHMHGGLVALLKTYNLQRIFRTNPRGTLECMRHWWYAPKTRYISAHTFWTFWLVLMRFWPFLCIHVQNSVSFLWSDSLTTDAAPHTKEDIMYTSCVPMRVTL